MNATTQVRYQIEVLPLVPNTREEWMPHGLPFKAKGTAELVARGLQTCTRVVEVLVEVKAS
jgi:hypothetical protein